MRLSTLTLFICFLFVAVKSNAQQLSSNGKSVRVEELPEYIVINCDNTISFMTRSIRIEIYAKK